MADHEGREDVLLHHSKTGLEIYCEVMILNKQHLTRFCYARDWRYSFLLNPSFEYINRIFGSYIQNYPGWVRI
jgi:hypothetical protein